MSASTATDVIPALDLRMEAPAKLRLDTLSHTQSGSKIEKIEAQKVKEMTPSPVSPSAFPMLCKDVLSNDERWTSLDGTATEYACTSESEGGFSSDSDPWSDDEDDDIDEYAPLAQFRRTPNSQADRFVLCLTSDGARPLDSTSSLCPQLPRRFSFRPLEEIDGVSQRPPHGNVSASEQGRDGDDLESVTTESPSLFPVIAFQNHYFTISESNIAGWGAFAKQDLKYGDIILVEQPLFKADSLSLYQEFNKLNQDMQEIALGLHANRMCKPGTPKLQAIWNANCFSTGVGDVAGLFPVASRFNHSCDPKDNIQYVYNTDDDMLKMVVKAGTIRAGEELTISYGIERTPLDLLMRYGFQCQCGGCPGLVGQGADEW